MSSRTPREVRTVGDLEVPSRVDEQVLGLEVAVDDVLRVQILERENEVRREEARNVGREPAAAPEVREQLAALDVLEQKVQVSFVLERAEPGRVGRV